MSSAALMAGRGAGLALLLSAALWSSGLSAQTRDLSGYPLVGLRFEGNQKLESDKLAQLLRNRPGARFDPRALERDLERLVNFYRAQGFLNARVVTTRTEMEEIQGQSAPYGLTLTVVVEEGPFVALSVLGLDEEGQKRALRAYELYRLGQARSAAGDLTAAVQAFRSSLAADPRSVLVDRLEFGGRQRVRLELALTLRESGERAAALEEFRKLVAAAPGDVASRLNLGQLELEFGQVAEALATFRAVVQDFPAERRAVLALGRALVSAGEIRQAREYLSGRAEQGDIEARLLLGDSYRLAGDLQSAAAEYASALRQAPLDYQGYARLSQVQEGLGQTAEAASTLRAYLAEFTRAFPQAQAEASDDAVLVTFQQRLAALSRSDLSALEAILTGSGSPPPADDAVQVRAAESQIPSGGTLATLELVFDSRRLSFQRGGDGARASLDIVAEIHGPPARPRRLRERAELILPAAAAAQNEGFPLTYRLQLVMPAAPRTYRVAVRDPLGGNTWIVDGSFAASDVAMAGR